jgi:molybdenum cofactor cytidylyltransferase
MNASAMPQPQIVILAAGYSQRLGRPKALVRIRGQSLLRRTARLLAPWAASPMLCVVPPHCARYAFEVRGLSVRLVPNVRRAFGLSSSVRIGMQRSRYAAGWLFVPVDLAELRRRDIARLVGTWRASRRRVAARRVGPRGGTPLILPKWLAPAAARIQGDMGLRELIAALHTANLICIEMPSAASDVDTTQDLHRARRRISAFKA